MNILITLHRGYGLGDCVQMSAVLRHVAKYRPNWHVDYQAEEGRHCVGYGIVSGTTFAYGDPYPSAYYDGEVQILLYDTWANWGDRPNTRVSSCLHERFDLPWDAECARYKVHVSEEAIKQAQTLTYPDFGMGRSKLRHGRLVAVHYQGDSSPDKKNLSHEQALRICKHVEMLGCTPLLLDWRNKSPLPGMHQVRTVGGRPNAAKWGTDAEMNCAVISQCAAFVGIDSGPSKCASATETPAMVIWTGHHPAPFHDPAPNTTHLVPRGYHGLYPVCNDQGVIKWFEDHYNVWQYHTDPVDEVAVWLREVLA